LLRDYDSQKEELHHQRAAIWDTEFSIEGLKAKSIDAQKVARGQLDEIRRNDIWPNWGTLGHALTVVGTIGTCLEGSCLIGLALGAISLFKPEAGVAGHVAESCLPNPAHAECAAAIGLGAAHLAADWKDEEAIRERLSDKERAQLDLANAKLAEQHFNEQLEKLKEPKETIDDRELFLKKAYEYARWGDERDNPFDQRYKREQPV
jgi:hypothetical protein